MHYQILFSFIITIFIMYLFLLKKGNYMTKLMHKRNLNNNSIYAHYSNIGLFNYILYPKLLLTNPIKFVIKKGDSIYIPKKWWHWIKSYNTIVSCTIWSTQINVNIPKKGKHDMTINLNNVLNKNFLVWKSKKINDDYTSSLINFFNNKNKNEYIITLSNHSNYTNNKIICDTYLKPQVLPYLLKTNCINNDMDIDVNFWFCSSFNDTGLHYDDQDGILYMLEGNGCKEIIMFPPSDTPYLYSIKNK